MRFVAVLACLAATSAAAEVPRVVTDFGPVQSLVSDVMGDLGEPTALLPAGSDPHDFQLRPSQADLLAKADLVFWVGPELIPSLGNALTSLAPDAEIVGLLQDGGGTIRKFEDGGVDPHGWLDPQNGIAWVGKIAAVLTATDEANAASYAANAARTVADLQALDAELTASLAPVKDRPFVVYHDALGYFTDHFGLAIAGAIELGDASGPSAAQLARIQQILADTASICVFPEAGRDPKFIASLSEGLDLRVGAAQDIEFVTLEAGRGQYALLLRTIALGLADCLGAR